MTLNAVATTLGIPLRDGHVQVEGDLDFCGTLSVAKDTPVGLRAIRLRIRIAADTTPAERARLLELTERYCVVYQTLKAAPAVSTEMI